LMGLKETMNFYYCRYISFRVVKSSSKRDYEFLLL